MKQYVSFKKRHAILVVGVGALVIIAGFMFIPHKKQVKELSLTQAFSQERTLTKKEQQAENEELKKLIGWKR